MQGIHVWRASLERSAEDVRTLHALLDSVERARATRFRDERDRRRFIVARATLRMLLGEYIDMAPQRLPLRVLPGGKPTLARESSTPELHFNLSHCGELALFAFSDREVGIDVERLVPNSDMSRVAAHFFSPDEAAALRPLAGKDQTRCFFRTWVRKEAYVKATGECLAIDPACVSAGDQGAGYVTLLDDDGRPRVDDRYLVHDLDDIHDHVAAVAYAACDAPPAIHYREWDEMSLSIHLATPNSTLCASRPTDVSNAIASAAPVATTARANA